jgi:hypothetical protein
MCESEPQTHQARARWLKVVHFNRTQELRCKVMVLGDKTVGKSALTQMFHSNGTRAPATGHLPRLVAARRYSHAQARFTFGCLSAQHYPKNYVMVLARYPLRYPSAVTSARDRRRRSASTSASKSYPSPTLTSRLNSIYLTRQARDPFPPSGRAAQSYRHVPKLLGLGSIANGGPSAGQSIFRDLVLSYVRRRHAPFAARPAGRHHLCLGMTC